MADTHHDGGQDGHGGHGNLYATYMTIAVILGVCTALSFVFNNSQRSGLITVMASFLLILAVAIVKATLVGLYFMHLKWDWRLLYFLIVPSFILGAMMMVVFLPDIYFGPRHDMEDAFLISEIVTGKKLP